MSTRMSIGCYEKTASMEYRLYCAVSLVISASNNSAFTDVFYADTVTDSFFEYC